MKAYLIADIAINDSAVFSEYLVRMPEFVEKYGAQYLVKGNSPSVIEGQWHPEQLVIIEFPNRQVLDGFLKDAEVQNLFHLRHSSTDSNLIRVNGCT